MGTWGLQWTLARWSLTKQTWISPKTWENMTIYLKRISCRLYQVWEWDTKGMGSNTCGTDGIYPTKGAPDTTKPQVVTCSLPIISISTLKGTHFGSPSQLYIIILEISQQRQCRYMQVAIHTYPMYRIPIWKPQISKSSPFKSPRPWDGHGLNQITGGRSMGASAASASSRWSLHRSTAALKRWAYKKYVTYAHRNIHTIQKNTHIYRHNIYLCITIYNYVHTCDVVCTYGIYMHLHHIESANSLCLKAPPFASWRSCHRVERLKILTATRSTARRIRGWPQVQLTGWKTSERVKVISFSSVSC